MTTDTVLSLYHSGALFAAGIVAVYLLMRWGDAHVSWIHAHYGTALVTALGVLAIPAAQGTTPNASMIVTALGTLVALVLPGLSAMKSVTMPMPGVASGEIDKKGS